MRAVLGPVGYDAAGPYIVLDTVRGALRVRPAGAGASLIGYHLALLGLGGLDPAERAAALATHLDATLQAAAADPAVLIDAISALRRHLPELADPFSGPDPQPPTSRSPLGHRQ